MSYIQRSSTNAGVTPFDIAKMSGGTAIGSHQIFDTFNVSWLSLNSSNGNLESTDNFFTEACFSPNSNTYGNSKVGVNGSSLYEQGQIMPESSNPSAGGSGRGDDISFGYGNAQFQQWLRVSSMGTAPDTALTHCKIMRL